MQQVWRKRWVNIAWFSLGAVSLVLLVSAVQKKNHKACKGIEVTFRSDGNNFFTDEKGVENLLKATGLIIGQPVETINLRMLEGTLRKDKWIADAQLFFDNNQVLQAIVAEKTPVARIFTGGGNSYYIDSACRILPLSEKLSVRIPMFTSFPSDRLQLSKPDSELLASVKELAMFIQADDFWKAQVAQIDITPDGFEMIPTVGNHVVELGKDGNWQQKFDRLFSFYKEVWTKVGFEKYEKIDIRFDGQVVATVKGPKPAIADSAKVRTAYEELFADVKKDSGLDLTSASTKDTDEIVKAGVIKKVLFAEVPGKIQGKQNVEGKGQKVILSNQSVKAPSFKQHIVKKKIADKQLKPATVKSEETVKQPKDKKAPKAIMKKPISLL